MSNKHKQAFPSEPYKYNDSFYPAQSGLTKREYFAAKAMQGLLASNLKTIPNISIDENTKAMCCASIIIADELLKQLEK